MISWLVPRLIALHGVSCEYLRYISILIYIYPCKFILTLCIYRMSWWINAVSKISVFCVKQGQFCCNRRRVLSDSSITLILLCNYSLNFHCGCQLRHHSRVICQLWPPPRVLLPVMTASSSKVNISSWSSIGVKNWSSQVTWL